MRLATMGWWTRVMRALRRVPRHIWATACMIVVTAGATTLAHAPGVTHPVPAAWEPELPHMDAPATRDQFGLASWYGDWHHGRETATGEPFDQWALTAAHPTLPFGSELEVTNIANGRSVRVRVNDRGPVIPDRVLDLSRAAAARIDAIGAGIVRVRIRVVDDRPPATTVADARVHRATTGDMTPSVRRASSVRSR